MTRRKLHYRITATKTACGRSADTCDLTPTKSRVTCVRCNRMLVRMDQVETTRVLERIRGRCRLREEERK
jgi:hypothetical protein